MTARSRTHPPVKPKIPDTIPGILGPFHHAGRPAALEARATPLLRVPSLQADLHHCEGDAMRWAEAIAAAYARETQEQEAWPNRKKLKGWIDERRTKAKALLAGLRRGRTQRIDHIRRLADELDLGRKVFDVGVKGLQSLEQDLGAMSERLEGPGNQTTFQCVHGHSPEVLLAARARQLLGAFRPDIKPRTTHNNPWGLLIRAIWAQATNQEPSKIGEDWGHGWARKVQRALSVGASTRWGTDQGEGGEDAFRFMVALQGSNNQLRSEDWGLKPPSVDSEGPEGS